MIVKCKLIKDEGDNIVLDCDIPEVKAKKKRKPSWYNVCVKEQFDTGKATSIKEAAPLCKGRSEEYAKKADEMNKNDR
ncbi:MAG: hypothetical protein ABIC57_00145 [bacterium]